MLSLTTPIVMRFVLAAAVTLPAAAYAADATHTDAATKDACEQCAAECTKCGDEPCCKACAAACRKCHDACKAMRP
jgi:hypothetical protein